MAKNKKTFKIVYNLLLVIFALVFVGCAIYLVSYFMESKKSEDTVDDLKNLIVEDEGKSDSSDDNNSSSDASGESGKKELEYVEINGTRVQKKFSKLYEKNNDFVGWLTIDGTKIDYPVVQSMYEEEYYIYRDFNRESNSAGTLFVDTSSDVAFPSDNILIYGHNMKTGMMFHDLLEYEDEDFYKEHKYIQFDTIYGNNTYEVIAAFRTEIHDVDYDGFKYYQFFDAGTETEFMNYVKNCNAMTGYTIPIDVEYGDKLLTLSTCAYHATNGRFVVVAVRIDN